jgi:hypothetical protein
MRSYSVFQSICIKTNAKLKCVAMFSKRRAYMSCKPNYGSNQQWLELCIIKVTMTYTFEKIKSRAVFTEEQAMVFVSMLNHV